MPDRFALHPSLSISVQEIGVERAPLVVIDNAFETPEALVSLAHKAGFVRIEGSGNHFPGVRAPAPGAYAEAMQRLLEPHLPAFGLEPGAQPRVALNAIQMVTTAGKDLALPQKVPHFDTFETQQVALLQYLTEDDKGGTDFYRHRSTGFERISKERFRPYTHTLVQEIQKVGQPQGYMRGSDQFFERIAHVEPRFNRVIAYFSNSLHSGHIMGEGPFPDDPRLGRLMATVFLNYRS
ncbi:DUF6445 family protein [Parvularcula lutaonensis]|uniref:DUF6445 family protein n=1 Tax=Parvularcula lutaonensis TaxID=491923 RepID=A0ABV7M8Z7_9PROT|nr:DUF6445 family protein [Parvularcula lutaonensis]GGY45414.1 hypothetical protein GCM10007148_13000 [Parvularcula lutaonensis]